MNELKWFVAECEDKIFYWKNTFLGADHLIRGGATVFL